MQLPEKKYQSDLPNWHLEGKTILLRADLNIPLNEKIPKQGNKSQITQSQPQPQKTQKKTNIEDDFRLSALRPTLDMILQKGGRIILITHIGRPTQPTPNLSTKNLIPWFTQHKYTIEFAATLEEAHKLIESTTIPIILLENIRFFPGEKKNEPPATKKLFAKQLAELGDYYVNDAFGSLHRMDTSLVGVPQLFNIDHKTGGLLVERELNSLNSLFENPNRPVIFMLGGNKMKDKIALIEKIIDNTIDNTIAILLCPALVFTFNKALNKKIGLSLVDTDSIKLCNHIIEKAQKKNISLVFPIDYQIASDSLEGPLSETKNDSIPDNAFGIAVGDKTIKLFSEYIQKAGTIFVNGSMGFMNKKETLKSMSQLLTIIASCPGTSIVAGGDTTALVYKNGLENQIDYLSTGGGATITYLISQQLPGLEALTQENGHVTLLSKKPTLNLPKKEGKN